VHPLKNVAISYKTESDSDKARTVEEALFSLGVRAASLPLLTFEGYSDHPPTGTLRKDGWIDHYFEILERSIGMIVIVTPNSTERLEGRGMWIERKHPMNTVSIPQSG
jgi:hypothetical protein